jgi:hypothetical protein
MARHPACATIQFLMLVPKLRLGTLFYREAPLRHHFIVPLSFFLWILYSLTYVPKVHVDKIIIDNYQTLSLDKKQTLNSPFSKLSITHKSKEDAWISFTYKEAKQSFAAL